MLARSTCYLLITFPGHSYLHVGFCEHLAATASLPPPVFFRIIDSYDNVLAETINSLYKAEMIHQRGPWRSFEALEFATLEGGLVQQPAAPGAIGNIPLAEAEQCY